MIVRSFGVQALRQCIKKPSVSRAVVRKFSTPSLSPESSASAAHPLVGVTTQLDHVAPRFEIEPSEIKILHSPAAFYETLKVVETDNEMGPTG
jgi:CDP-diacylglycerol--glycerol-3-phosphate 3-phosphatidyltransferase